MWDPLWNHSRDLASSHWCLFQAWLLHREPHHPLSLGIYMRRYLRIWFLVVFLCLIIAGWIVYVCGFDYRWLHSRNSLCAPCDPLCGSQCPPSRLLPPTCLISLSLSRYSISIFCRCMLERSLLLHLAPRPFSTYELAKVPITYTFSLDAQLSDQVPHWSIHLTKVLVSISISIHIKELLEHLQCLSKFLLKFKYFLDIIQWANTISINFS